VTNIYKEFGVDVLRDCCSENAGPTAAEMKMAREIERLRARVEVLERVRAATIERSVSGCRASIYELECALKEAKP
jgi:hypothetical protein